MVLLQRDLVPLKPSHTLDLNLKLEQRSAAVKSCPSIKLLTKKQYDIKKINLLGYLKEHWKQVQTIVVYPVSKPREGRKKGARWKNKTVRMCLLIRNRILRSIFKIRVGVRKRKCKDVPGRVADKRLSLVLREIVGFKLLTGGDAGPRLFRGSTCRSHICKWNDGARTGTRPWCSHAKL